MPLLHESQCIHWLLQRNGPPDFTRQAEGWWLDVPAFLFVGMDTALSDFYTEAGIASLWQTYQPAYRAELARYQSLLDDRQSEGHAGLLENEPAREQPSRDVA